MDFTYKGYEHFLQMLEQNDYTVSSYDDTDPDVRKKVILRHDIDYSLKKTVRIAEIENEVSAKSTFFLLLCTDFYNIFSAEGQKIVDTLLGLGHDIGLHFDEQRYPDDLSVPEKIREHILEEADIMSHATGRPVTKVSMHRPSSNIIGCDLQIPGMINTYGSRFINEYKYISDSRRRWREPVDEYISRGTYDKLQILVHPFWYNESELDIRETIKGFIDRASYDRYDELDENITNLHEIVAREDI